MSEAPVVLHVMSVVDYLVKIKELSSYRRSILKQLVDFALLVYYDVKHAFLVDICCLTKSVGKIFIDRLNQYFNLNCSILFILQLGHDIFIVNKLNFETRYHSLEETNNFTLAINLSVTRFEKCNNELVSNISHSLRQTTSPLFDNVKNNCHELRLDSSFEDNVGMPCMAGWLLSYACIYRAVANTVTGEAASSSALSMTPLCKVSLTVMVRVNYTNTDSKHNKITKLNNKKLAANPVDNLPNNSPQSLELMSFTVPQSVLDSDPTVCMQFDQAVCILLEEIQCKINHPSGGNSSDSSGGDGAVLIVDSVAVSREVVTLSAVAL
jgi:hypothetical protein